MKSGYILDNANWKFMPNFPNTPTPEVACPKYSIISIWHLVGWASETNGETINTIINK